VLQSLPLVFRPAKDALLFYRLHGASHRVFKFVSLVRFPRDVTETIDGSISIFRYCSRAEIVSANVRLANPFRQTTPAMCIDQSISPTSSRGDSISQDDRK
jgi:hypothetical protein